MRWLTRFAALAPRRGRKHCRWRHKHASPAYPHATAKKTSRISIDCDDSTVDYLVSWVVVFYRQTSPRDRPPQETDLPKRQTSPSPSKGGDVCKEGTKRTYNCHIIKHIIMHSSLCIEVLIMHSSLCIELLIMHYAFFIMHLLTFWQKRRCG